MGPSAYRSAMVTSIEVKSCGPHAVGSLSVTRASAVASAGRRRPRRKEPPRTRRRPANPCARPDSNLWNPTQAAMHRGDAAAPHAVGKPAPPTPTSTAVRGVVGSVPSTRQPTSVRPPKCARPGSSRWSRTLAVPRTVGGAAVSAETKMRRACPPSGQEPPAARSAPDPAAEPIPRQPPRRRAPPGSSRRSPIPGKPPTGGAAAADATQTSRSPLTNLRGGRRHGLKQWRGIATRYGKTATSYLAGLHIVSVFLWPDR